MPNLWQSTCLSAAARHAVPTTSCTALLWFTNLPLHQWVQGPPCNYTHNLPGVWCITVTLDDVSFPLWVLGGLSIQSMLQDARLYGCHCPFTIMLETGCVWYGCVHFSFTDNHSCRGKPHRERTHFPVKSQSAFVIQIYSRNIEFLTTCQHFISQNRHHCWNYLFIGWRVSNCYATNRAHMRPPSSDLTQESKATPYMLPSGNKAAAVK